MHNSVIVLYCISYDRQFIEELGHCLNMLLNLVQRMKFSPESDFVCPCLLLKLYLECLPDNYWVDRVYPNQVEKRWVSL